MAPKKKAKRPAPNREKSAVFSTRMDPELRRQVEASAKKASGGNLSKELDRLLRSALAAQKEKDEKLRAVNYLLSQLARLMPKWHDDAFMFRAFQFGIFAIMNNLAPEGEETPVDLRAEAFPEKSSDQLAEVRPEEYGERLSSLLWLMLEEIERPGQGETAPPGDHRWALPQARDVLKVKSAGQRHKEALIAALLKGESK
jgi:hypothetical protein